MNSYKEMIERNAINNRYVSDFRVNNKFIKKEETTENNK